MNDFPRAGLETLALFGTNDIHGTLTPIPLKTHEEPGIKPTEYTAGGAAYLASYFQILKSEFGDDTLWLDAGDEFQGSIESNLEQGAPVVRFFNFMGLHAATVGNHEFDFGQASLRTRMKEAKYPYLGANIMDEISGSLPDFSNLRPRVILTAGKLKVGVIGLSTLETPTTTRSGNVDGLKFEDLKTATLREASALRREGAHVVVLAAHVGLKCEPGLVSTGRMVRRPNDPQGQCGSDDELVKLLNSLPSGTLDAVISGHSHEIVHHWVAGIPVIQGGAFGRYFNVIYLTYDWSQKKLLSDLTRIEGPVPVCEKVFKNQSDCNGDRPPSQLGRGPLVTPRFHGQEIFPHPKVATFLEEISKKSLPIKTRVIGSAARKVERFYDRESSLGNLVADALREAAKSDFSLVNPGGLRASIPEGPITFEAIFRSLPFDNSVSILRVTGLELTQILSVAQSGAMGIFSISGLRTRLIDLNEEAPWTDYNKDGTFQPWKTNRLLEVTDSSGKPLKPDQYYTLATLDFLATGGDHLDWPMSQIPSARVQLQMESGVLVRDAVISWIERNSIVNSTQHSLVNINSPRIIFEKSKKKLKKGRIHKTRVRKKGRRRSPSH